MAKPGESYYNGGCRVMIGGVPVRLTAKPTPTMLQLMRDPGSWGGSNKRDAGFGNPPVSIIDGLTEAQAYAEAARYNRGVTNMATKSYIARAKALVASLDAATLDKHGKRLRTAAMKIVDGGETTPAAFDKLAEQIDNMLNMGAPVETKSTRRRAPADGPAARKDESVVLALDTAAKLDAATKSTIEGKSAAKVARTKARAAAKPAGDYAFAAVADPAAERRSRDAAKLAANPDRIVSVKPTTPIAESRHMVVSSEGGDHLIVPNERNVGDVRKLAVVGGSLRAVRAAFDAAKGEAKLANGITGRDAPHASKAVADRRASPAAKALDAAKAHLSGKPAPKAAAKSAPAKEARKAERAAKAAPKGDDTRKITIVDKAFTFGAAGSKRRQSWDAVRNGATVADYAKAGGALKYLPRWAAVGAIKLG